MKQRKFDAEAFGARVGCLWRLTKRPALDGESEKGEPNLPERETPGDCAQQTSHLERVRFLQILAILGH